LFADSLPRYDSGFKQLATGDVVLFTGEGRVQALGPSQWDASSRIRRWPTCSGRPTRNGES